MAVRGSGANFWDVIELTGDGVLGAAAEIIRILDILASSFYAFDKVSLGNGLDGASPQALGRIG
jgi:hypothetical protein